MNLFLQFWEPTGSQMNIFEHNPAAKFNSFFNGFISKFKTFSTTNGNRYKFAVWFFAELFYFKAGIETWGTWQQNWLFGFACNNYIFEVNSIVFSTFLTEDGLYQLIGHWAKFVRPEYFD